MNTYKLYWSPTGQHIATVTASDPRNAVRKAPKPYKRYLGEIYAVVLPSTDPEFSGDIARLMDSDVSDISRDIAQHNAHYSDKS